MTWFLEVFRVLGMCIKASFELIWGIYRLSRIKRPMVSVFGGKAAYEGGKYTIQAHDFAALCAKRGMAVITGGGPGIMEAANCGAYEATHDKSTTLGIMVRGVDMGFKNKCANVITVGSFFVRKWLLMRYSCAFALFPGGIGTMDEFFEVLNMVKLRKTNQVPIILVGSNYWKSFLEWYNHAFEYEFIEVPAKHFFVVTDDLEEACNIIVEHCFSKK